MTQISGVQISGVQRDIAHMLQKHLYHEIRIQLSGGGLTYTVWPEILNLVDSGKIKTLVGLISNWQNVHAHWQTCELAYVDACYIEHAYVSASCSIDR